MSLPAIVLKVLSLLNKEGIKAEVYPMYGSCTTKFIITLPGVEIDQPKGSESVRSSQIQSNKH